MVDRVWRSAIPIIKGQINRLRFVSNSIRFDQRRLRKCTWHCTVNEPISLSIYELTDRFGEPGNRFYRKLVEFYFDSLCWRSLNSLWAQRNLEFQILRVKVHAWNSFDEAAGEVFLRWYWWLLSRGNMVNILAFLRIGSDFMDLVVADSVIVSDHEGRYGWLFDRTNESRCSGSILISQDKSFLYVTL